MITIAKWVVVFFGVFLIAVGFLMLFAPKKARAILLKAGSTNFINYAEITIRMIPAAGLVVYSDFSKYPEAFRILGWFMIATSVVLYFIPRKLHHNYALKCAEVLTPVVIRLISPLSFLFESAVLYAVI